jgi:hypothetical protein
MPPTTTQPSPHFSSREQESGAQRSWHISPWQFAHIIKAESIRRLLLEKMMDAIEKALVPRITDR